MFNLPKNFILITKEFLSVFKNKYTYNLKENSYIYYGFLWGLPVIVFSLFIDFSIEKYQLSLVSIINVIRMHSFHIFALMQPFLFAIIFGAMGTVRYQKDKRLYDIIDNLEEIIDKKTQELLNSYREAVVALASAIESKDKYTLGHCERVKEISLAIADKISSLTKKDRLDLEFACILHDIGKIGISRTILNKTGSLTAEEYENIKSHSLEGVKILSNINSFQKVRDIIMKHHERPDGKGYPYGIKNNEILSSILSVADAYDAMTSDRPYHKGISSEEAIELLKKGKNKQFSAKVVDLLESILKGR